MSANVQLIGGRAPASVIQAVNDPSMDSLFAFMAGGGTVQQMRPVQKPGAIIVNSQGQLQTNALLRKDEWEQLDERIVQESRIRLVGINDLRANGLIHNLNNIGITISEFEREADMTEADVSMQIDTQGQGDSLANDLVGVPVPVTYKDFRINARRLAASRKIGESVDVSQGRVAARLVMEQLESTLFQGRTDITIGGLPIFGYITHPDRGTGSLAGPWDNPSTRDPVQDVLDMMDVAAASNYHGPFTVYYPGEWSVQVEEDYKAESERTIRQRIEAIQGVSALKAVDVLTAANGVVLVQMTEDVVDLALAQDIVTTQWDLMGGLSSKFRVWSIMVQRVKSTFSGNSGIVQFT